MMPWKTQGPESRGEARDPAGTGRRRLATLLLAAGALCLDLACKRKETPRATERNKESPVERKAALPAQAPEADPEQKERRFHHEEAAAWQKERQRAAEAKRQPPKGADLVAPALPPKR